MLNRKSTFRFFLLLISAVLVLPGCALMTADQVGDGIQPVRADRELTAAELLDVAIAVFDSKELSEDERENQGLTDEIRQAEQRFVPIHLKYTMQRTGYWGAVRVVPGESCANVLVKGTILHSDGERMDVEIVAQDSRAVNWFSKTYSETLKPVEHEKSVAEKKDPFQDLYNTITNDLVSYRNTLNADEIRDIQRVSELRFAADMAQDSFSGYLAEDDNGHLRVVRLPDESDPMLKRVRVVKVRDEMLADVINGYYDMYYQDLWAPYADWRKLHSEEAIALKAVKKEALGHQLLGAAAILGAILVSSGDSDLADSVLPGVMVMGGAAAFYSGLQKRQETRIHKDAIAELAVSFSSEAEPLVVEVEGEMVRLSGSAEEQYTKWRGMLREIYAAETGLPLMKQQDGKIR